MIQQKKTIIREQTLCLCFTQKDIYFCTLNLFDLAERSALHLQSRLLPALLHGGAQHELASGQVPHVLQEHVAIDHAPSKGFSEKVECVLRGALLSVRGKELFEERGGGNHGLVHVNLLGLLQLGHQV